jgi:hypothetical protein
MSKITFIEKKKHKKTNFTDINNVKINKQIALVQMLGTYLNSPVNIRRRRRTLLLLSRYNIIFTIFSYHYSSTTML